MKISKIGGVIAAANKEVAQPLLQVGAISIIRRIVISYQQAGIFPIVVVTDLEDEEVKRQLTGLGVIFLQNEQPEQPELMQSVRIGLSFLLGKCDRVAFTPVNVPMFTPATLSELIHHDGAIVAPSYHKQGGHPVLLDAAIIPQILTYEGDYGLRGAIQATGIQRVWVPVEDKGVIASVYHENELQAQRKVHNRAILYPSLHMQLEQETPFFSARLKLLLFLIADTQNMRLSCAYSGIAHSKAWDMINRFEENVGYQVVERYRGGRTGGSTKLTEQGEKFLRAYQAFEEELQQIAMDEFQRRFICTKILG